MHWKYILLLLYSLTIAAVATTVVLSIFGVIPPLDIAGYFKTSVLGETATTVVSPEVSDTIVVTPPPEPTKGKFVSLLPQLESPTQPSIPTSPEYSIRVVNAPSELTEGDIATFTWAIAGTATTIKTTTVYLGSTSVPGIVTQSTNPSSTPYTDWLHEFMDGNYAVPLTFVASKQLSLPGTIFFRAYAAIDGKNYWGEEQILYVKPIPKHEIRVLSYPTTIASGETATFTWEILGPSAVSGFVVIAGGKVSHPGTLDPSITLTRTPYGILTNEFTNGSYTVPLRFTGNAYKLEPGVYYFRALAFIDNTKKNIWSDEYSFTVQ